MIQDHNRKHGRGPEIVGADAGYDAGEFLIRVEKEGITPHVAMTSHDSSRPASGLCDCSSH